MIGDESPRMDYQIKTNYEKEEEYEVLEKLPYNGCSCNSDMGLGSMRQKKGCINAAKWLN